jgi:DNA-binding XRE family transcriptional regulator
MTAAEFQQARQSLGLSQSALGNLLGLTKRQIIRIEAGDLRPIHALALLALIDGHRVTV